jgi:low temperature requirement protein LtrA
VCRNLTSSFLCATFVFSVSLWWIYPKDNHHRDTKDTEDAQRGTTAFSGNFLQVA